MDEELIVGGNDDEEEEQEQESEDDYEVNIPVQARHMLCNIDRDELITFRKIYLNNGAVDYVSLRGEFYRCNVCSKNHCKEGLKDAHADYCKQSKSNNKFYDQLQHAILEAGYPDVALYIKFQYGGEDEPFIPPPHKELKSNPSTSNDDSNSTYNKNDKKPLAKKIKIILGRLKM